MRGRSRPVLSGIATCGKCGQPLRPSRRKGRRHYRCIKSDSRPNASQGISISADPLDDLVVNATLELLNGIEITVPTPTGDDDLDEIDAQLDELAADWARGDITRSEWRQAREILVERRDTAERSEQRTSPHLAALATATNLEQAWPQLDIGDQRAVLRDLYDAVSIGPAEV
ncbi:MAG: zinc ribbon domain-containing protein [Ilumatobacteraceae bacterium]